MANGLWTLPPWGRLAAAPKAWTTLRVAHSAHSPYDGVVLFSANRWARFR